MSSILVMVMGANQEIAPNYTFYDQFKYSTETWLNKKNRPTNISVLYYDGGEYLETSYEKDEENGVGILHLACEDDLNNTFKKTWLALKWVRENLKDMYGNEYDYIFRTNTSTFINLNLLNCIEKMGNSNDVVYASELYSLSEAYAPYPLSIYPRGNGIFLSKLFIDNILLEGISILYIGLTDDVAIGNCINSAFIKEKELNKPINGNVVDDVPYHTRFKGLKHGWYHCVDNPFNCGHKLSNYGDNSDDPKHWERFVTIQMKMYRQREKEEANFHKFIEEVWPHFKKDEYKVEEWNHLYDYCDSPSIFIGSAIGYINYDYWKEKDLNELYLYEISHKASDDAEYYKRKEIQGKNL